MRDASSDPIAPRPPERVMRLGRMGSFHASRLSFMRILLRRLKSETWTFDRPRFDFDARGVGVAIYTARGPSRPYSLVAFGHDLAPQRRSDRVIATAWDATFALCDGIPNDTDIDRLRNNIPKQEAGRVTASELSVSRANRSVRLWNHVVECLSEGRQPDCDRVDAVGYLMRTTAVYGSGKLGAADREATRNRPELHAPFQIEMLSVYLIRAFVMDLVEHIAAQRAPDRAVRLDPDLRRRFGIGNSTGLGMAPFLLNHPALLNAWVGVREEALRRLRGVETDRDATLEQLRDLVMRAALNAREWRSEHPLQKDKITDLRRDLAVLGKHLDGVTLGNRPWNALWIWAEEHLSPEGQEQLASLLLELHPGLVDGLATCLAADEAATRRIDGAMALSRLRAVLEDVYDWALNMDWSEPSAEARIWYVSAEKQEPRLGDRTDDALVEFEQPLCPGRDAACLYRAIQGHEGPVAPFLIAHPEHRHMVRRAQIAARLPYAEIRDNTIAADMLPIDLLRAKLSFFGAGHFDPRSDRWVRINMYRGAPFPAELSYMDADDWTLPPLP